MKKDIVFGPKYIEHVYSKQLENWTGIWKKIGEIL